MGNPHWLVTVIPNKQPHTLPSSNTVHLRYKRDSKDVCCTAEASLLSSPSQDVREDFWATKPGQHKGTLWFLRCKSASAPTAPSPLFSQSWHFHLPETPCSHFTGEEMKESSLFTGQDPLALLHRREFTIHVKSPSFHARLSGWAEEPHRQRGASVIQLCSNTPNYKLSPAALEAPERKDCKENKHPLLRVIVKNQNNRGSC